MGQPLGSQYVLHERLGRGAMGQVFRGTVRHSGAPVAVKVLKPELVSDAEIVARFFQERSILTSINHPNVAKVLDLVVEGDTLGIVMELVEGQDLRRYLRQRGALPPAEAVQLACQLLQGLAAVHAVGIIHRDVKPENMLVKTAYGQGNLKLTDFGVARLTYGASLTNMTSLIGTPEYMAPELADHDRPTAAADLYSAGIVLYEMLAGRTPFAGGHPLAVLRRQVEQPPPPIPGVPGDLWTQIDSLLSKDPRSRSASAAMASAQLDSLQPLLSSLPALPPATAAVATVPEPTGRGEGIGQPARPGSPPDGQEGRSTVLRHRGHGSTQDDGAPAVYKGIRSGHLGHAALTSHQPRRRWSWLRSWPVTLALAAAVAVLATALGLQNARSASTAPRAARPQPTASYAFPARRYPSGLVVTRRWTLGGQQGSQLTEVITASSATGKALNAWFKESIPTAIASTVQTLRFTSAPARIVRSDPVVQWYLRLPAHGAVTIGYVATIAPEGATAARLASWARGLNAAENRLNTPTAKHPRPSASPTSSSVTAGTSAGAPGPSTSASAQSGSNPSPWPTYNCDPTIVTCQPSNGSGF